MKKTLIFLLLFPAFAFGQTIVTKDTAWQVNTNGSFYSVRLVEYSNGESSLTKNLIGDTATLFRASLALYEVASNRMANVAFEARDFDKDIRDLIQRSDSILLFLGKDVVDTLAVKYGQPLLQTGWTVIEGASSLDVAFSINAQGQLRYQITGFPVRNAQLLGRAMRLQNYKDTGEKLDVYNAPGGNWFSIDNKMRMRFPGNQGLNRSALPPPNFEAETIKLEPVSAPKKPAKPKKQKQ